MRAFSLLYICLFITLAEGKVFYCMDAQGQRIFSDKPCVETMMGEGGVSSYEAGNLSIQKIPVVLDDQMADKIRYRESPTQIREKYCAKYNEVERNRLVQTKQVILGMYLADVIKVLGAPIASDGNRILFQEGRERVMISLLEGCVINIDRDYREDDEFFNPQDDPVEDYMSD